MENSLSKYEYIEKISPFLITNYISNRSSLIYKKIKIALKQRNESIPSGPSAWGQEDIPDGNDDLDNFLNENATEQSSTRGTMSLEITNRQKQDAKLKIDEKFVHNKLDKMCGMPQSTVLFFNRQDIKDQDKKMRNDETLGMYLEDLAANAKIKKCQTCDLAQYHHS